MNHLPLGGPIALDSAIFIYFVERHPEWRDVVRPIFKLGADNERALITSELTLTEVLVVPYRVGDLALAERYEALLTRSRGLSLIPIDRNALRAAAQLRARYGLKTPDSIQIAAALSMGCSAFITNDRRLPQIPGLRILQLSDLA